MADDSFLGRSSRPANTSSLGIAAVIRPSPIQVIADSATIAMESMVKNRIARGEVTPQE